MKTKTKEEINRLGLDYANELDNRGEIGDPSLDFARGYMACQEHHDQFKRPISDEEIEKEFPTELRRLFETFKFPFDKITPEMAEVLSAIQYSNVSKQFGVKWAIERMAKDDRELLVKLAFQFYADEEAASHSVDEFLNSNK